MIHEIRGAARCCAVLRATSIILCTHPLVCTLQNLQRNFRRTHYDEMDSESSKGAVRTFAVITTFYTLNCGLFATH